MNSPTRTKGYGSDKFWKWLYITGGVAALLAVVVFRRNLAVELMEFGGFGLFNVPDEWPVRASDWFTILQADALLGLILLGMVDLINYGLLGLTFLALYGALRNVDRSVTLATMVLALVGITVYFASNQALAIQNLSESYATAISDEQRAMFLAAGEALLAINDYDSTGFFLSRLLVTLSGLLFSIVLLRSPAFYKATAYTGILTNSFMLLSFLAPIVPTLLWLAPTLSAPFRIAWMILIAIGLFRLAKSPESGISTVRKEQAQP